MTRRALAVSLCLVVPLAAAARAEPPARRVVSMNPSLTATLIALGAGSLLVGVDDYSARQQPAVRGLPTVGGLFNPSLEAVVALEPDLVVLVPSAQQRDVRDRLAGLGIEVLALPNITLEELLDSIEVLGARVGRQAAARARVGEIRGAWRSIARATGGRPRVRTVVVIQRDPLYVVGSGSFIDSMLRAAGAQNAAAGFPDPYPRVAVEWMLAAAPEVILDASEDSSDAAAYWSRWPSLPAVGAGRVLRVPTSSVMLPGPHPDRSLRLIAEALHGAGVLEEAP
jgi:iron complex transport system substrate-binding protein